MKYQDRVILNLAKKYNKDPRVIKEVVYSPIKFANRIVSDPVDIRPIRVRYFGVFTLKHLEAKVNLFKDRVKRLKGDIVRTMIVLDRMGYFIKDNTSMERILDEALESRDFEKIQDIWEEHLTIKKVR